MAAIGAAVVLGKVDAAKVVFRTIVFGKIVCGTIVFQTIVVMIAEIRENGARLNLAFAQGGQIVGYRFLLVEPDVAGVGAYETFIENAAGKLVEVFLLEGAQHAGADFCAVGDGVEGNALLFALLAKFFSERTQGRLRRAGVRFPSASR